ncbi:hypothetical protein PENTCL1PPCAC_12333, partial [Pristionchus entomophagus]
VNNLSNEDIAVHCMTSREKYQKSGCLFSVEEWLEFAFKCLRVRSVRMTAAATDGSVSSILGHASQVVETVDDLQRAVGHVWQGDRGIRPQFAARHELGHTSLRLFDALALALRHEQRVDDGHFTSSVTLSSTALLIGALTTLLLRDGDITQIIVEVSEGDSPSVLEQAEEHVVSATFAPRQQLLEVIALPSVVLSLQPNARPPLTPACAVSCL